METQYCPLSGRVCANELECKPAYLLGQEVGGPVRCPIVSAVAALSVLAQALLPMLLGESSGEDIEREYTDREQVLLKAGIPIEEIDAAQVARE